MTVNLTDLIAVAKGDMPRHLLITNAKIVNVFFEKSKPAT